MQNNDLSQLGGAPGLPLGNLNLAGSHGVPAPGELFQDFPDTVIQGQYDRPDMSTPKLSGDNPAHAPLTVVGEFARDPLLPDLTAAPLPFTLDLYADPLESDGLLMADQPDESELARQNWPGLGFPQMQITRDILAPDPPIPDLQHPELTQEVTMPTGERPGDLDPQALDVMHQDLSYQQITPKDYPEVFMDQRGVNDRRSRKFTLLMKGLDAEERGREL